MELCLWLLGSGSRLWFTLSDAAGGVEGRARNDTGDDVTWVVLGERGPSWFDGRGDAFASPLLTMRLLSLSS